MTPWKPLGLALKGKVRHAARVIVDNLQKDPMGLVKFQYVMKCVGIFDSSNFRKSIRKHPDFMQAMAEEGIIEWGHGVRPTGFAMAGHAYGF